MTSFTAILKMTTCIPFGNAAEPKTEQNSFGYTTSFYADAMDDAIHEQLVIARLNDDQKREKQLMALRTLKAR